MERNEIKLQYKWDLSLIYKNQEEFDEDLSKAKDILKVLTDMKDIFTETKENFLKFNQESVHLSRLLNKTYVYAHLNTDVEPENQTYQYLLSSVLAFSQQVSNALDFVELEIIKNKDQVKDYLTDDQLKVYQFNIENILREEKHLLSQEMETLLSKVSSISNTAENVFEAFRLDYEDVLVDGETKTLNSATLSEFLKNKDPQVREMAYHNFFKEYKKYENVFAAMLSGQMNKDAFYADVRKFPTPLSASQWNDDVPEALFYKILEKANKQYRPLFHRYNALKKKILKLDTLHNYDLNVPLTDDITKKYTVEECWDIILDVVSVYGEEYINIIKQARQERWIDFYPTKGKRIGGYSSGCYDTRPYILLNFIGEYDSLSTMIHELGNSAHT